MLRLTRHVCRALLFVVSQLAQSFQILGRLGYILLLMISGFLVQLHICLYIGDHLNILAITSDGGFYPLYDGSKHAERFLICCGAFLWLGYILPNRKGVSLWAQGRWARQPPLWVAFLHMVGWLGIWGPLADFYTLYEGMSPTGILVCLGVLAGMFYIQVWQDIVSRIRQTQKIKLQREQLMRRTQRVS